VPIRHAMTAPPVTRNWGDLLLQVGAAAHQIASEAVASIWGRLPRGISANSSPHPRWCFARQPWRPHRPPCALAGAIKAEEAQPRAGQQPTPRNASPLSDRFAKQVRGQPARAAP